MPTATTITTPPTTTPATLAATTVHREDLDPRPAECLVCYVDRLLARHDCPGTLALTETWRTLRAPRATTLPARLHTMGADCDCHLLTRCYEPVPDLLGRRAGPWDRPTCAGIHRGSAQPCTRWRRRHRWT